MHSTDQRRLRTLFSIMRLCRAGNSLALGLLFFCTNTFFVHSIRGYTICLQAISWTLVASFAYAYNDIRDVDIDKINRPDRPIPARSLTLYFASCFLRILATVTIVFVIVVWRYTSFWPLISMACSIVYSRYLRSRSALLSNLTTSALIGIVPLSAFSLPHELQIWALSLAIALLMFARELQKDAMDADGDAGHRPSPLLLGKHKTTTMMLYPWLLLVAGGLLHFATYRLALSMMGLILRPAVLITVLGASFVFLFRRTAYSMQATTLKIVSYILVILLATGA